MSEAADVSAGRNEIAARGIAIELLRGATAEVVGHKYLSGFSASYIEVDGVLVQLPPAETKEAPAVRVSRPDGFVALFLASSMDQAEALLRRAEELARV